MEIASSSQKTIQFHLFSIRTDDTDKNEYFQKKEDILLIKKFSYLNQSYFSAGSAVMICKVGKQKTRIISISGKGFINNLTAN